MDKNIHNGKNIFFDLTNDYKFFDQLLPANPLQTLEPILLKYFF